MDAKRFDATKDPLKLQSLYNKYMTDEEKEEFLNYISHDHLPAVRSESRQRAESIYDNWRKPERIVQRREANIQRRWTNKSIAKRRELLLTTWPNINRYHRPDLYLNKRP